MSETRPSDSCRICKFSFRVKFGNVSGKQFYSSSQNLFKPSQRKDSFGIVLADVCKQVGLVLLEDPQEYSDRVCNSCARKILTLGNLFQIVKTATLPTIGSFSTDDGNGSENVTLKIGPQCVRVATAFLFALVCEYGAV